ncbi:MAG: hypothetical protein DMF37_05635 [Verrucomicrobia bacterium]|nr:MAG: hypothetical protein DMF37_05635 [Verrucomicrobiota bacterium]
MKRVLLLVIIGAVAAFGGWYVWNLSQKTSSAYVSVLLPRDTIFLAHMPDFNQTRDQWHHSDIYLLYREPAVQDFLRKPLANFSKRDPASQTLQEIEQLDPKNAFIALTSIDNNSPKVVGGFRFQGSVAEAERVVGKWRSKLLEKNPGAKREKLQYERHEIELVTATPFTLATAYDRPWFFAATDLTELKGLLDHADRRAKNPKDTLDMDEAYHAAVSRRPSNYAVFFYLQPKTFAKRLAALRAAIQSSAANQRTMLEQVRSISGVTRFENGKINDLLFLGMPKLEQDVALTRSSLTLGTKETFFYLSMLLNLGEKIETLNQVAGLGGIVQKILQSFFNSGITADDWKAAFGVELGSLADWPSSGHWPSLLLTLPVVDSAKAGEVVEAVTRADEDAIWTQTEKDGVRYFSMQSPGNLIAITPTIALSNRILIAGFNPVSVEEAVKRSGGTASELADSPIYKGAERLLPAPTNFFAYIDTALLYSRLDAALRPMLLMAAAFMPAMTKSVDLGKLPSPEVITKHLSPIVSSQRYDRDGYVAESIGPVTLDQSVIGLAILSGIGATTRQKAGAGLTGWGSSPTASPQPTLTPSPTP